MNRLQKETSPYLLQHAHNPVHWYAWREEAFEAARRQNKPILVSIGYSTCHWCHVMERESFENEDIAAIMNEYFVNIKVDREERPDVDQIYMEACQAINGNGGWPLNCFLTPEGKPFFAGTYFPPQAAYNRPSWGQVMQNIYHAFTNRRDEVEEQAQRLLEAIAKSDRMIIDQSLTGKQQDFVFDKNFADQLFSQLSDRFDRRDGGFGGAPKFPGTMSLSFLLRYHFHTQEQSALDHVLFSLDKMIQGGIYDQLGGGFARYATDKAWLIPHFEKMLYDNALLVSLLTEAWQVAGKPLYQETIEETLDFIAREMSSPQGGFYAALDADSEGVEGKFYVWTKAGVEKLLGEDAKLFCLFYDVTEAGNWEGNTILWRKKSFADFAREHKIPEAELRTKMQAARQKLFQHRSQRIRPGLDDKQILGWNALMITAYAEAYGALGTVNYLETARQGIDFLLSKFADPQQQGAFLHTYKDGIAQYPAFLDDYAFLIEALLAVYQIDFDPALLEKARQITEFVVREFTDTSSQLFFFTHRNQKDIPLRRKEIYDSAQPSGNSTMVRNLQKLGLYYDNHSYQEKATEMLKEIKGTTERYPTSFSRWAWAMLNLIFAPQEIAVVGENAFEMASRINQFYLPGKLIMATKTENEQYPLLQGKPSGDGTYIYVCQNYTCQRPVDSIDTFKQLINTVKSY